MKPNMSHSNTKNRASLKCLKTKLTIATIVSTIFSQHIYAHTSSVGYENAGPGAVTFWYGTYHNPAHEVVTNTEGSLLVEGPNSYASTVPFSLLVYTKPTGLIDGETNFYSNGTQLVGTYSGTIYAWQGATFTNLSPGTYTFTYVPIDNPTQTWAPMDLIILSSSVVLDASVLGSGLFKPNSNSINVGAATVLDSLVGGTDVAMSNALADLVLLSKEQQTAALNRIAPNTNQASSFAAAQTISGNLDTVQMRLDSLRIDGFQTSLAEDLKAGKVKLAANGDLSTIFTSTLKKHGFWTKVFGGRGNQDMRSGFAGYNMSTAGMAFGGDTLLDNNWVVGGAFTYAKTNVNMSDFRDGDRSDIKTYQLTAYAAKDFGKWYLESMLAYARQNYDSSRNTAISGIAKGSYDGDQLAARVNIGFPLTFGSRSTITPIVGLEWINLKQDGYTEKGGSPLALKYQDESADRVRSLVAVKFSSDVELSNGIRMLPAVQIGWRHDFKNDGLNATTNFIGGGASFKTEGQEIARNTYSLGGALRFQRTEDFSLSLQLDGERTTGYSAVTGQIVGHWKF